MFDINSKFNVSLGRWFDVPVVVHWSLFVLIAVYGLLNPTYFILVPLLFFIVLLHECGHCIAAQKLNIPTQSIILTPIGGVASISASNLTPKKELIVTVAGPAVNLILVPFLYLLAYCVGNNDFGNIVMTLGHLNLIMLIFNLIPAFPLDGGRIFRSLFAMRTNYVKATTCAVYLGRFFAVLFGIGFFFGMPMLALIGVFIWFAGDNELKLAQQTEANNLNTRSHLSSIQERIKSFNDNQ